MFGGPPYAPTYSGPIKASGDVLRRSRNSAMAQSEFAGNQRAFRPRLQGVGAGSGMTQYQAGVASDVERAKGMQAAQQALADNESMLANANLQYQSNDAEEMAGIRNLLQSRRRVDQSSDIDLRGIRIGEQLSRRQRDVVNEAERLKREATVGSILAGLFRS
jgi:hypothetical protein